MNNVEGRALAEAALSRLRGMTYGDLVDRFLNAADHEEVVGPSGTTYQIEIDAFWDSGKPGDLRVTVAVDDGGLRAFAPLTTDFIIAPDGTFVGE
jgi:hypothetical protein